LFSWGETEAGGVEKDHPDRYAAVAECDWTPALPRMDRHPNWTKVQAPDLTVSYSKQST
jgi:hypothetical protein